MTLNKVVLLLAVLVASASSSDDYRLPNNTKPISYDIEVIPYIVVDNFTFDGKVEIFLEVLEPTFNITLHSHALNYEESNTTLISQDAISQNVTSHTYDTDQHFLIIGVQDELSIGNYTLSFTFVGILDNDLLGFYRSSYTNASGETVWFAATKFEPFSARRAFPCYDEPALKATFRIAIKHDRKLHALSNMPIAEKHSDETDGKMWSVFERTPIMSTYLVAFVVSDFSAIKNADESYNVWSRPNAISDVQYAYDKGSLALAQLEKFTNITYHLPKLDQISFPNFVSGAMENWGLVTYMEASFHYNRNTSTPAKKQRVATVISHELAHQWFGNLVSPAWWKYLWLNEGFATYFQYLITDEIEDNWRLMDQFVVEVQQAIAFDLDSHMSSKPMNDDAANPTEIRRKFQWVSYRKAACIIRMASHFLTEDAFKAGLTKYLNANAFGVADSDVLFEALQEAESDAGMLPADVYVKDVMDTWVEQSGYPVVTVTRNYTTGITEITQERFLNEDGDAVDVQDYKWWIPINWASQTNPDFKTTIASEWIHSQNVSITINGSDASGWVIFNKQQTGYYRVNYDETNWAMIANYLNSDNYLNIHVLNRAALIDDAINLAKVNRLSYTVVLELTLYLHREVDPISWYPAIEGIKYLDGLLANTKEYESIRAYLTFLASNFFNSVGIEETDSDDHMTRLSRNSIIEYACRHGLDRCRSSAEAKLVAWLNNSTASPISPTLQRVMICAGLRSANITTWNKARERYLTAESTTERSSLIAGLGCAEDETIINTWLKAIINSTTGLTTSDSARAINSVIQGSVYNVDRVFDFIVDNLDSILSYFDSHSGLRSILFHISSRMTTTAQLEKLKTFIAAQSTMLNETEIFTVSGVESNIAWNAAHQAEINAWIAAWLTDFKVTGTTQEYEMTTSETVEINTESYNTTILENEVDTMESYDKLTLESSTATAVTAYITAFTIILEIVCIFQMT